MVAPLLPPLPVSTDQSSVVSPAISRLILLQPMDHYTDPVDGATSPLHHAVSAEHYSFAEFMLRVYHANPSPRDGDGNTPLHIAVFRSDERMCRLLLSYAADQWAPDNHGCTPLHVACFRGFDAGVHLLIESSPDRGRTLGMANKADYTPLHMACDGGKPMAVKLLLEYGANANATTINMVTPLWLATKRASDKKHGLRKRALGDLWNEPGYDIACLLVANGASTDVVLNMARGMTAHAMKMRDLLKQLASGAWATDDFE